jgi:hypothetical protein
MAPPVLAFTALTSAAFATLVALDGSSASVDGYSISRGVYLTLVYPLLLSGAGIQLAAAYGLLTERPIARKLLTRWPAVLLIASILLIGSVTGVGLITVLLSTFWHWVLLAFSFWYFYGYERVRQYYAQLENRHRNVRR